MRIFITGGTGFVGKTLVATFADVGWDVTVLTRKANKDRGARQKVSHIEGNPTMPGDWQNSVADHNVIVNLAGSSILNRWTEETKKTIRESRVLTTRNLVQALPSGDKKNALFLSASAVGYYGFQEDEELDEMSPKGDGFLSSVTQEWEAEAQKALEKGMRVVLCRFGMVLGSTGGALSEMIPIFRKGLGSPLGKGTQWISWIHINDLASICQFLIEHKGISGPVNFTSPHPVRNVELAKALGQALEKPTFLPAVPAFLIRLIKGELASAIINGQKVLPRILLEAGFEFRYPTIREALDDIIANT